MMPNTSNSQIPRLRRKVDILDGVQLYPQSNLWTHRAELDNGFGTTLSNRTPRPLTPSRRTPTPHPDMTVPPKYCVERHRPDESHIPIDISFDMSYARYS